MSSGASRALIMDDEGYRLVLLPRGQVLTAFVYASKSDIFYCVLSGSLDSGHYVQSASIF